MNYIKQLNAAFEKFYFDDRLNPTHISLYMALFQEWNSSRFALDFFVNRRDLMNAASADAPYVASGTPTKSAPDSMAAKWFNQIGGSAGNFNLTSAFADAKAKQQQILGNTTPVGLLAANQTGYFNFLKDNSLTKGIL